MDQVLKPLRYSVSWDISALFLAESITFLKDRWQCYQPLWKFLTILSTSRSVSVKSLRVPCLLTSGSFRATGDNIIEYKAPGTGFSPCQDQFQVRGCKKVAENSLKWNCEISSHPKKTPANRRGSCWKVWQNRIHLQSY